MKSPLLIVLGITSTILGIYILLVSLFSPTHAPLYHAGCYLPDQPIDLSLHFRNRLRTLRTSAIHARQLYDRIHAAQLIDPQLRHKSVELTKHAEVYIQKMTLAKKHQQSNMHFFTQLTESRQAYENCANDLKHNLDLDNSQALWTAFQTCPHRYEGLKSQITSLYNRRDQFLKDIDVLLAPDQNQNPNFDFEEQLRKIREKYERLNAQNDKNKENYVAELKRLQHMNQSKSSQYDQSERVFTRATLQYDICIKNLKQFKKCQDISNALKQYGYVEPVQSLEKQIKSKRQILLQMSQLLRDSKRDGQRNDAITEMYEKRAKQLLQTITLRVNLEVDEMKECGCKEETRAKLESDLENSKMKMNTHKKQINDISYEIYKTEKKIKDTDETRMRLVRELTQQAEGLKNREKSNILSLKEKLEILRRNLDTLNSEINSYNSKLHSLEFECNQYQDRLGGKLPDGERVTECWKNKDFFEKLNSKASLIVRQDAQMALQPIEAVRQALHEIKFPQTADARRMIAVAREYEQSIRGVVVEADEHKSERTLKKQVISIEREVTIETPSQKVTIVEEEVITIEPVSSKEL